MDALIIEEGDFVLNSGGDRKLAESMGDRRDVLMFLHSHRYPSCTVVDVLELWKSLARDTNEKCIAAFQPRRDNERASLCQAG